MSTEAFSHALPWTEEEYLALGETVDRVELFDGSLLVSPAPANRHQVIAGRLFASLLSAADAAGLHVLETVNIRLKRDRIPIPDLVIVDSFDLDAAVVNATSVLLVCEIVSPSSAATDRLLKMHYYAEAGIPWYLLVEQQPELVLRLLRLENGHYAEHATGRPGRPLRLTDPVAVELDPEVLLPRR
jgi:Uma2 family endonuclease